MRRKLSSNELTDGLFVQCVNEGKIVPDIYKILIKDDGIFYTIEGKNWEMSGELVKDGWWETEETISLNRDNKLKQLGI